MKLKIEKTELVELPQISDGRGNLTFVEGLNHVPFEVKRIYYLYDVSEDQPRGMHAHRHLKQLIIAIHGKFDVLLDDGCGNRETIELSRPNQGLQLETLVWREVVNFSLGAVCLVLASEYYDESDYIRSYNEFIAVVAAQRSKNKEAAP